VYPAGVDEKFAHAVQNTYHTQASHLLQRIDENAAFYSILSIFVTVWINEDFCRGVKNQ
jgi:hypothetical protein